jgi:hypothetical protein
MWNGTVWTVQPVPVPAGATASFLSSVSCTAGPACVAVGTTGTGSFASQQELTETWDGAHWTPQRPQAGIRFFRAVSCVSASVCTASASEGTDISTPAVERWNGSTWTRLARSGAISLAAISCTDDGSCAAVGNAPVPHPADEVAAVGRGS